MLRAQPFKQPVASIIATRKKYLATILHALEASNVRPHLVEPAPFALLRAALARHKTPRGVKSTVRVFLGDGQAISLLTAARSATGMALSGTVLGRRGGRHRIGGDHAAHPEQVLRSRRRPTRVVHGRPDLATLQDSPDWLKDPIRTRRHVGPSLDDAGIAFDRALGLFQEEDSFNLVRETRPKGSLPSLIPWKQIAAQVGVLVFATMMLHANAEHLDSQLRVVKKQQKKYAWLGTKAANILDKERAELKTSAAVMQYYFETRALWTGFVREASEQLMPKAMTLNLLECRKTDTRTRRSRASTVQINHSQLRTPIAAGGAPCRPRSTTSSTPWAVRPSFARIFR